jgi:hypothetical protein
MVGSVTLSGVTLSGLRCALKPGAVVVIQYDGSKAEFLVVWTRRSDRLSETDVGLQRVSSAPSFFESYVGQASELEANA